VCMSSFRDSTITRQVGRFMGNVIKLYPSVTAAEALEHAKDK